MKLIRVVATAVTLVVLACSSDSTGPSNIEGRYELRTVNGATVPASTTLGGELVTINSGFWEINKDGSFTFGFSKTGRLGGTSVTQELTGLGVWVRNKNAVQFNYQDGSTPEIGAISGGEMSMTSAGVALVFRK